MKSADSAFLAMIDGKAEEMKEKILRSKDEITYTEPLTTFPKKATTGRTV